MTSAPGPTVEAQAEAETAPPAFRFQVQPEFHVIPLGLGADESAFDAQMAAFARDYWGGQEEREPLRALTAALYGANSQHLASEGAVYSAMGVFPVGGSADESEPPERVSRCTLLVSVQDLDNPDPMLAAAGIAETLARGEGGGDVLPVGLPAGPAVVHVSGTRMVWELPDGRRERFAIRIEIWLPFPDEDRVLLMSLSTADVQDLYMYQAVLADIADSITFDEGDGARGEKQLPVPSTPTPNPFG
ncbi:hypothetical protein M2158_008168 [Streptomyces sp. SAI-144]|uniref:hypothetical protein n=1 Tax=unclassified Streptomyces TaxID=2593676 RepID=UPI002476B1F7|nr:MULTISPECIES: hypothetical protein [unclassified Streptomyces]MDH6439627.1 hypothetical protein [Streptomyces sp. SAI-144]MDH6486917.1 hypothetical protein [Streptomyces sp. SAI-127]